MDRVHVGRLSNKVFLSEVKGKMMERKTKNERESQSEAKCTVGELCLEVYKGSVC